MDLAHRPGCERDRAVGAGHVEAVLDIVGGILQRERGDVVAHRDALAQLAQVGPREAFAQFGLATQDDLHELVLIGFEVGEQSHLLHQLWR